MIFAAIFALSYAPASVAVWPETEARCDALGSECVCNETLDWNAGTFSGVRDPSNAAVKECRADNGGSSVDCQSCTTVTHHDIADGDPLPDPGNVITRVLLNDSGSNLDVLSGEISNWAGETLCIRSYYMLESTFDVPVTANDERIKFHRFHSGSGATAHPGMESNADTGCDGSNASTCPIDYEFGAFTNPVFGETTPAWSPTDPMLSDIRGEWIRQEFCTDHYGAGGGNLLRSRVRLTRISDDTTWEKNGIHPNSGSVVEITAGAGGAQYVAHLDTPNWNASPTDMYASAVLMARRSPVDDTFWIGAASEIEGSGGGASATAVGVSLSGASVQ